MKVKLWKGTVKSNAGIYIILYIALFYYAYRYPLKINSTETSPTYSNTPEYLQLGKFLLLAIIGTFFILINNVKLRSKELIILLPFIVQFVIGTLKSVSLGDPGYFDYTFWPILGLILPFCSFRISFQDYIGFVRNVFIIAVFAAIIEFLAYKLYGRLPALAYAGTLDVRFGSFLDDPNGFAALCAWFLGWISFSFAGPKFIFMFGVDLILVGLTQSFTGIATIMVLGGISVIAAIRKNLIAAYFTFLILIPAFGYTIFLNLTSITNITSLLFTFKSGSAAQHINIPFDQLFGNPINWLTIGDWSGTFFEPGWIDLFLLNGVLNFSLILIVFGYLTVLSIQRLIKADDRDEKSVYATIAYLNISLMLGDLNLPFFKIFPINFLFFLLNGLMISQKFYRPPVH